MNNAFEATVMRWRVEPATELEIARLLPAVLPGGGARAGAGMEGATHLRQPGHCIVFFPSVRSTALGKTTTLVVLVLYCSTVALASTTATSIVWLHECRRRRFTSCSRSTRRHGSCASPHVFQPSEPPLATRESTGILVALVVDIVLVDWFRVGNRLPPATGAPPSPPPSATAAAALARGRAPVRGT